MLKLLALCVSLVIEIYGPVYGLTPGALSTYVSAPGKVLPGPIPPNSFKASRNVTLTQCAAECSLALHLKEFDCYAFEYLPQNSMCVLTNVTSLVLKGGYLGLLNNPNMNYYEKSKEHFVNLFQPYTGKTLTDQGTYFAVFHNMTLDSCALYCLIETRDTCMSFSYSQTKKACGLSRVFYSADNQQTLTPNPAYTHYQYFTSWPCNASIPWNYTPRAIASPYFPYASVTDVNCYLEIEAPIGKQVELNFSTFFTQKSMCDSGMSGIRIYDGNSPASAELSRLCSTENFVDRRFLSSSGYLYIHFATGSIPMAFKAVFDFFDYDPCESAPCQHGGNCSVTQNGSGACACAAGYTGSRCEVNVDDCASNPCVLGGKCVDLVNDFRCECPRLLGGRLCNEFVGLCYTQPCANGATCSPRGTSDYVCTCLSGYTGPNCSQALPDPCRSSPCLNGATCHSNVLRGTFACQCRPGFQGGLCETNINECASNPCLHNIPCVDMVNDFRCACPEFMVGKRCETFVGECYRKPCQHGTCSPTDRYNYTCTCEASYTGQHCDTRFIDFCNPSPCKHGSCQSFADGPMCKCDFGYSGFFCDHKTDFCADVECAHGECESHDDDFRCKCAPGFEGKYCNETIDHCKTADCHGGFCINTMTSHFCVCKGGRTAPDCGTSVKQCGNLTCINGTCAELGSGLAKCQCFDHYTGSQCETWIDTCGGHPCAHGVCVRQEKGGHTCECDNNYTGLQCDSLIDPCLGNKCVYGFCSSSNSSYECVCGAGYHGQFCQYKPGEIEPSTTPQTQTTVALTTITTSSQHMTSTEITCRCKYGACDADFLNVCLCWHGFDGPLCENFQGCGVHNPCSHGNCTDEAPGSVNCTCDVGFAGELCRVADPCLSNPCHSNGQCNVINLPSGGATYHCTCNEGLTGTRCETSSACAENPCSFGTCIPTDDGHYKCSLDPIIGTNNSSKEHFPFWMVPTSPTTVVPLHQRSDIECLPDVISVYLPKSLLPEERNITWREDACDVTFNGTHYVSTISLSECGTTVSIDNTTVTFTNELVVHKMSTDNAARDADDVIIFGSSYETVIPVHCVYPRFNNVSSAYIPVKQSIRFFEKRFGELDISMDQFDSEAFARPLSLDGAPRKVPLDEDLYIRVGLSNRPSEVRVRADQCIATASSNPADRNWRQLIDEGCAVNGVRLLSNDSDGDVRFALKAFDFRHNASGFVFLHCQVSVCGVADDSCRMGCLTRSRRAVNGGKSSHLVSTGPFYVEREQEAHKQIVTMPTVFATVCLLVAMVAVVVAIMGWTRRHHGNQKM